MTIKAALRKLRSAQTFAKLEGERFDGQQLTLQEIRDFYEVMQTWIGDAMDEIKRVTAKEPITDADLAEFGWEPGEYFMTCRFCGVRDIERDGVHPLSSKHSIRCRPCAVKMAEAI